MKVPKEIKKQACDLIEQYGDSFEYLGNIEGADYFVYRFPDDATTGFPFVYQYEDGSVMELTGFEALDIIELFVKDVDEIDVE